MSDHPNRMSCKQRLLALAVLAALVLTSVLSTVQPAQAAPAASMDAALTIVPVGAPAVNCLFDTDCTITVSDLADHFLPPGASGDAFLQSRTWPSGEPGTAGAGLYAYLYRIDLRNAAAVTARGCVTSLALDFGPVTPLDYDGNGSLDSGFVVTSGGLGNVQPAAANQAGSVITFLFDPAVCAGTTAGNGDSSFFFGLASTHAPQDVTATLGGTLGLNLNLKARAPKLSTTEPGCYELYRPEEIPAPALINFDDLPDAATIGNAYQATYGVNFYAGADTKVITYADRESDPTKARSPHNVAANDAVFPATSRNVPLTFTFDTPKTHVGFYMGNGATAGLAGAMVGYDAAGKVICQVTNAPVPETYSEFIGMYDPAGRISKVTLDYGDSLLSEVIDDLYFAPYDKPAGDPLFGGKDPVGSEVKESDNHLFSAAFTFPDPQLVPITGPDQVQYSHFLLGGVDPNGSAAGMPDVPVYRRMLAVPHGATPRIQWQTEAGAELTTVLYPSQPAPMDQGGGAMKPPFDDLPFAKDDKAYASDAGFPAQAVDLQPLGQMRDLDVWQLALAAGQYNPAQGVLRTFKGINLEITFEGGSGGFLPEDTANNPFDQSFAGLYAQALNYPAVQKYLDPSILGKRFCIGNEFVIVTDPAFRPAADALRTWKISKGISTAVVETGAPSVGTTPVQIRDYLRKLYNNCLVRPSYVLLLGDAETIAPFYYSFRGSDLGYVLMNDSDNVPDIAGGRIPVDTLSDAQAVVDKIVAYEHTPPFAPSFYGSMSFASYFECCLAGAPNPGTDSRSFVETAELVRSALQNDYGYTVDRIYTKDGGVTPRHYFNGALLPADMAPGSGFAWNGSTTDIVNAINAGRMLVFHRDHGGPDGWVSPSFESSNLSSLTNGALTPVVYSVNCASGLFDNETLDPSIQDWPYGTTAGGAYWAERMLRMPGGAVGIIGDTRNSPTWANSALARGLFDATWPDVLPTTGGASSIRRLGDILNYAKTYLLGEVGVPQTAGSVGSGDANTDVILYHVFGDPTLELWTSNPHRIYLPKYYTRIKFDPTIWELGYPVEGATITALQDGNPVGRGTVQNGKASLQLLGDGSVFKPDLPVQFVAERADGIAEVLQAATAVGGVKPGVGGSLGDDAGRFHIDFPGGAVDGDATIVYIPQDAPPGDMGGDQHGLRFFELDAFNADGSVRKQFDKRWHMELGYSDADFGITGAGVNGVDEKSLHCSFFDDATGQWQAIPSTVDAANNKVQCEADHFTRFALASGGPNGAGETDHLYLPAVAR